MRLTIGFNSKNHHFNIAETRRKYDDSPAGYFLAFRHWAFHQTLVSNQNVGRKR